MEKGEQWKSSGKRKGQKKRPAKTGGSRYGKVRRRNELKFYGSRDGKGGDTRQHNTKEAGPAKKRRVRQKTIFKFKKRDTERKSKKGNTKHRGVEVWGGELTPQQDGEEFNLEKS